MQPVKKTKLYKLSLFLLGLMVLVNFGFCLMSLTVSAQILNKPKEIIPEVSQENINFSGEENCEDTDHDYKTGKTEPQKTRAEQSNSASNKNTVLPCCLDHEKITKIDNAPNPEINSLLFYATSNESLPDSEALIQNLSSIQLLDLPPPKADVLFSVFKKE